MTDSVENPAARAAVDSRARSFRFVLEYDGSDFEGWQVQAGTREARTIQGELEAALAALGIRSLGGHRARVRGAGRTDAGVHAMGQVASARLDCRLDAKTLLRALNARLPRDIVVLAVEQVPEGWDALREARGKHYRYQIWNGLRRSPLRLGRWHWVAEPLDLEAMQTAAPSWIGQHDFAAFQGAGSAVKTTVRTLEAIAIAGATGAEIQLDFRGEGFLRHMVRNLAGTLIEIGRGRWAPAEASEILGSCDRARAGPTAPASGLQLVAVRDSWSEGELRGVSVDAGHPVG